MGPFHVYRQNGWRRTGAVNLTLVAACIFAVLGCLIRASRSGSVFGDGIVVLEEDCSTTAKVNLFLHFLINVVSTIVLASSNFFMQVLSSPSRDEIDRAHAYLRSMDIGIPSVKNVRLVSRFKQICWVVLFLSSFPIHLLFNSAVFETGYEGSSWTLTIATEDFVNGADYFVPGASLSPAGSLSPVYVLRQNPEGEASRYVSPGAENDKEAVESTGYGDPVALADYWDVESSVLATIQQDAESASRWARLEPADCLEQYRSCQARIQYFDVVIVVDSGAAAGAAGWTRSEVFNFDPSSNLSQIWDSHVPPNQTNSLWYSTTCSTTRTQYRTTNDTCVNTCLGALGYKNGFSFPVEAGLPSVENWILAFQQQPMYIPQNISDELGFDESFNELTVEYCLARNERPSCKIGVSNVLLLTVLICMTAKLVVCSIVVLKLSRLSLVTPGDAMESFISKPDPRTLGLGTLDIADARRLEFGPRKPWSVETAGALELTPTIRPRQWRTKHGRLANIISKPAWTRTYCLLGFALVVLIVCTSLALNSADGALKTSFGHSDESLTVSIMSEDYSVALIVANLPQILLSMCYFSYNAFFTRIEVEKEWNSYSIKHRPLRVTYPVGEQIGHYRLQLPYKYSVPLLGISVLLHWLVSNTIYIFIVEGGYWADSASSLVGVQGLDDDALVAVGFSPPAILTLMIISIVLCIFPILWSLRKVKGNMVAGGSNSLIMSAACHACVSLEKRKSYDNRQSVSPVMSGLYSKPYSGAGTAEENALINNEEQNADLESEMLRDLVTRKIMWGALPLPTELSSQMMIDPEQKVLHLGFAGEEYDVQNPIEGHLYA
ncbi:hypothetical protein BX600DRAFT_51176 [Xylariales sp. PMI_506]|nr:hypothetical protein BX600DRAFT_51176 [Xylariales sp. PMI_506]